MRAMSERGGMCAREEGRGEKEAAGAIFAKITAPFFDLFSWARVKIKYTRHNASRAYSGARMCARYTYVYAKLMPIEATCHIITLR